MLHGLVPWTHAKKNKKPAADTAQRTYLAAQHMPRRSVTFRAPMTETYGSAQLRMDETLVTSIDVMGSSVAASAGSSCSRRSPSARIFSSYLHSYTLEDTNDTLHVGEQLDIM